MSDVDRSRPTVRPMPSQLTRVLAVWSRHVRVYSGTFLSNAAPAVMEPLFLMASLGLGLGRFVPLKFCGVPYPEYVAAGLLGTTALYTASFESTYGTFVRMTYQRTYAAMTATPVTARDIVLGEILFCGTKGFLFTTIVCVVLTAVGAVSSWTAIFVPIIGFVVSILFAGLGLFVSTLVSNMNQLQIYFTAVLTPLIYFSGLMFPVGELPGPMPTIAHSLPMFHAIETMRWAISGPEHLAVPWGKFCPLVLLAWAAAAATFGAWRFERKLRG